MSALLLESLLDQRPGGVGKLTALLSKGDGFGGTGIAIQATFVHLLHDSSQSEQRKNHVERPREWRPASALTVAGYVLVFGRDAIVEKSSPVISPRHSSGT